MLLRFLVFSLVSLSCKTSEKKIDVYPVGTSVVQNKGAEASVIFEVYPDKADFYMVKIDGKSYSRGLEVSGFQFKIANEYSFIIDGYSKDNVRTYSSLNCFPNEDSYLLKKEITKIALKLCPILENGTESEKSPAK